MGIDSMKLEIGKRYLLRDGRVTGPLTDNSTSSEVYLFWCEKLSRSWTPDGDYLVSISGDNSCDIVAEYEVIRTDDPETDQSRLPPETFSKDEQRQAFEAWAGGQRWLQRIPLDATTPRAGEYYSESTQFAWLAWCEAQRMVRNSFGNTNVVKEA